MPRETKPILCYVTDRQAVAASEEPGLGGVLDIVRRVVAAGVDWIQIREKDLPTRPLFELVCAAVVAASSTSPPSSRILVNDRLDVALAGGAGGVHLGGASLPVAEVTRWLRAGHAPADFLVGVSCHSLAEAVEAETAGADYVFFGPLFATPSKAAFRPPQGISRLAEVCQRLRIPVLAIGGVTLERAAACLNAGAAGIAAIRLLQENPDVSSVVTQFRTQAEGTNPG